MNEMKEISEENLKKRLNNCIYEEKISVSNRDFDSLLRALISLYNFQMHGTFNANTLIVFDRIERSNTYGKLLGKIMDGYYPNTGVVVNFADSPERLYSRTLPAENEDPKLLIVQNFTISDPEQLFDTLCRIEENNWNPAVILCTTTETMECIRNYDRDDHRLFYYLCMQKILISEFDVKEVKEAVLRKLEQEGFEITDAFIKSLNVYLEAVYPEAIKRGEDFILDLLFRIRQEFYHVIRKDKKLDETAVPYSRKAELLLKKIEDSCQAGASKDSNSGDNALEKNENEIPGWVENGWDFSKCFKWKKQDNFQQTRNKKEAGIFLVLSKYSDRSENAQYDTSGENSYWGVQTNDAPVQYLIDKVIDSGYNLKKVVCINTPEVEVQIKGFTEGQTAFVRFKTLVEDYLKFHYGYSDVEEIVGSITYKNTENDDEIYSEFYRNLNNMTAGLDAFFVDYTGGLRDTSFLMVAAIRFLEFKGIKCEKVVYSDFFSRPKKLKTLDKVYELFQMINGMNEFVSTGMTRQLDDIFKQENTLMNAIRKFSHATNVGDMENIDQYVKELNKALDASEEITAEKLKNIMIFSMGDMIKKKLFGGIELVSAKGEINYYQLIDWCIENRMYQQAVVLYIEKVPVMYDRKHIIDNLVSLSDKKTNGSSREARTFYMDLPRWLDKEPWEKEFIEALAGIQIPNENDWERKTSRAFFDAEVEKLVKSYPEAGERLKEVIKEVYDEYYITSDNKIKNKYNDYGINQSTICVFHSTITASNGSTIQHYLLKGEKKPKNDDEKGTKMKIIKDTLERPKEKWKTNDDTGLCRLMAFYLAIKLLRNKMSHAVENAVDSDENVIRELETVFRNNFGLTRISISLEEDNIHTLLEEAMKYTKEAKPFTKNQTNNI